MSKYSKQIGITLLIGLTLMVAGCSNQTSELPEAQVQSPTQGDQSEAASDAASESTGVEEVHDDLENFNAFSELFSKSAEINNLYYEFELRVEGVSREYYSAWVSEDKVRLDPFDQEHSIFVNKEDMTVQILDRATGILAPAEYNEAFINGMMSPAAYEESLEQDMFEHVHFEGSALVDGLPCDVFEVHSADLNVTYYLWKDNGLSAKVIAQITGFPKYEYYFRSLTPNGATQEALNPPADAEVARELVEWPSIKVGQ